LDRLLADGQPAVDGGRGLELVRPRERGGVRGALELLVRGHHERRVDPDPHDHEEEQGADRGQHRDGAAPGAEGWTAAEERGGGGGGGGGGWAWRGRELVREWGVRPASRPEPRFPRDEFYPAPETNEDSCAWNDVRKVFRPLDRDS